MNISKAIAVIEKQIGDPSKGLPDELFLFVTRIVPMINVDLLVKDEAGRVLLSWRDDPYSGKGWHLPGGIIRFKETMEERVKKVAKTEIGVPVDFDSDPIALNQLIHHGRSTRSHFISVLYNCSLPGPFIPKNKGLTRRANGYLKWHDTCPDNLLKVHNIYKKYFNCR